MRNFVTKRKIGAAVTLGALGLGGVVGYAYWTSGGTGTGTAKATTTTAVNVNQTTVVTGLYPGSGSVALSGTFDNSAAGAVPAKVTSLTASVTATSGGAGCLVADFPIVGTAVISGTGPNNEIAVGNPSGSWSGLSVSMLNTAANQDACKNATVTITYTAS